MRLAGVGRSLQAHRPPMGQCGQAHLSCRALAARGNVPVISQVLLQVLQALLAQQDVRASTDHSAPVRAAPRMAWQAIERRNQAQEATDHGLLQRPLKMQAAAVGLAAAVGSRGMWPVGSRTCSASLLCMLLAQHCYNSAEGFVALASCQCVRPPSIATCFAARSAPAGCQGYVAHTVPCLPSVQAAGKLTCSRANLNI